MFPRKPGTVHLPPTCYLSFGFKSFGIRTLPGRVLSECPTGEQGNFVPVNLVSIESSYLYSEGHINSARELLEA